MKLRKAPSMLVPPTSDMYLKQVNDMYYELEIYPKFIYYERITDKGERPHKKAIVNQKVDSAYLKKNKLDKLPFNELYISRKATFDMLLRLVSKRYEMNPKLGRLWIEEEMISGAKLGETLENFGISMG